MSDALERFQGNEGRIVQEIRQRVVTLRTRKSERP